MNEDRCIVCGAVIPEGRQVCRQCELSSPAEILKRISENTEYKKE